MGWVFWNWSGLQGLAGATLVAVPEDHGNISDSGDDTNDVGAGPGNVEADLGVDDVGHGDEGIEAAGNQGDPNELLLAVLEHPDGDCQEGEQGQGLVGPCEVTPQDVEALGVQLGEDQDDGHQSEDDGRQAQTLAVGALVDVQGLCNGQTQAAQSGVTGGDGQNHDAGQSDDTADRTQDVLADSDDSAGSAGVGSLLAQVEDTHGGSSPDHGDEAFQDHHVVEGHAALLLALHGTGDDSSLRGVEAGQDAAGHGDKEHRQEVAGLEVLAVAEGSGAVSGGLEGLEHNALPVVPQLNQGIALGKQADEHADGGEHQDAAEDGIDLADDGVDGEHGSDQIIGKNRAVDDPGGNGSGLAVEAEDTGGGDVAGGVDEHGADQQEQQADKHVVCVVDALVAVLADHGAHLSAAVTQADHAGEIVVHGAADDVADGDGDESDGSKQDALNGSEDGAGTCDVQQVDEAVLPALHGNVVHAVLLGIGGSFPVVGAEDLFAELAVNGSAHEQDHEADEKCNHKHTPFSICGRSHSEGCARPHTTIITLPELVSRPTLSTTGSL